MMAHKGGRMRMLVRVDGATVYEHVDHNGNVIAQVIETFYAASTTIYTNVAAAGTITMRFPPLKPTLTKCEENRHNVKQRSKLILGPKKARWK